jgi:hypothetical protein
MLRHHLRHAEMIADLARLAWSDGLRPAPFMAFEVGLTID